MSDRKLKSRRSSILKPPKPRNPLSDVDLNPPLETTIKSRRVSFANVHFKKEFTADPEKNTIWHNSYEEEMNKSDKSDFSEVVNPEDNEPDINMSVEDMSLDSDVMNCTQIGNLDCSMEAALACNSLETSIISVTVDLTEEINSKAPMLVSLQNHPHFQEVERQITLPSEEVAVEMVQVSSTLNIENYQKQKGQTVHYQQEYEELDVPVPPNIHLAPAQISNLTRNTINFIANSQDANMDISQAIIIDHSAPKHQTINFNTDTEGETMDLTQFVPSQIHLNQTNNCQTQKRQTINFNTNSDGGNMDITQGVMTEIIDKRNKSTSKRQTKHFNTEEATMEITQSVPAHFYSKKHNFQSQNQQKQAMNQQKSTEKENKYISNRQTIHFNAETEGATMEITQSVPAHFNSNKSIVQQIQNQQGAVKKENICSTKRQTIHFNNETEGATMEITQSVPAHFYSNKSKVRQIPNQQNAVEKENICSTKRQTIHFNAETEGATMEITQSIPAHFYSNKSKVQQIQNQQDAVEKENICSKKRQTIHFNNEAEGATMEITQPIPAHLILNLQRQNINKQEAVEKQNIFAKKRQTIHFNNETEGVTMEITQSVPAHFYSNKSKVQQIQNQQNAVEKENICSTKRQTIHFNTEAEGATMEITQPIPAHLIQNLQRQNINQQEAVEKENIFAKKRQTIHFNNETEGVTMEITQSVPAHFYLNKSKVQQIQIQQNAVEKENICSTKRHTIHFNNEAEGATMEITQPIPAHLIQYLQRQNINQQEAVEKENKFANKRQTIHFNNETEGAIMDITQSVSSHNSNKNRNYQPQNQQRSTISQQKSVDKENKCSTKRQTIHFNSETEGAIMNITQPVLAHNVNRDYQPQNQQSQIIHQQESSVKENKCATKRQTIHFNNETEGATMEITQSVPTHFYLNKNKDHHTQNRERPTISQQKVVEKENKGLTKRQTIHFNSETEDATMEITQSVPTNFYSNKNRDFQSLNQHRQTIHQQKANEKENLCSKKRQTIHFNTDTEGATMEITHSVPAHFYSNKDRDIQSQNQHKQTIYQQEAIENENKCSTKRQTIHFNTNTEGATMEITQSVPEYLTQNLNQHEDRGVEMAQVIGKKNKFATNRQTLHFNNEAEGATMEITQSFSPHAHFNETNDRKTQKRQTINFKNLENESKLDITQAVTTEIIEKENKIPSHFNKNQQEENKSATNRQIINLTSKTNQNCQAQKRQTINFHQNEEDGDMEMTDTISTEMYVALKENSKMIHSHSVSSIEDKENIHKTEKGQSEKKKRKTILEEKNVKKTKHDIPIIDKGRLEINECVSMNLNEKARKITKICQETLNFTKILSDDYSSTIKTVEAYVPDAEIVKISDTETAEISTTDTKTVETCVPITETVKTYFPDAEVVEIQCTETAEISTPDTKTVETYVSNTETVETYLPDTETVETYIPDTETAEIFISATEIQEKLEDNLPAIFENTQHNKIFRLKGQPLILDPNSEDDHNSSDICQRIKLPGQSDNFNVSKINLTDKLDITPINNPNSFNLTENLTSIVDSTEKLINCNIEFPQSEYTKIISADVFEKNYSIVDTSFPNNSNISDISENSNKMYNFNESSNESGNKVDNSIISVNSSVEVDKSIEVQTDIDEIKLIMSKLQPVPKFNYNYNLKEELSKISKQRTKEISENVKILLNIDFMSVKERAKKYNMDLDKYENNKNNTMKLIQIEQPQYNLEVRKPKKMFQEFEELCKKQLKAQEENTQREITLEDKIKHMINKDTLWNLIPNEEFSFTFMNNSVKFIAQVDRESEIVKHVEFFSQIDETTWRPIWIYINQIQSLKLEQAHIKSAIGQTYTIFSLLDYVTKIGEELMDILEDYQHLEVNIGMKLDRNLKATLQFTNLNLCLAFEVSLNINNLENMSGELVSVKNLVGSVDENALKRLIKFCPPGFSFLREYDRMIQDYLKVLLHSCQN